jgi:hypothetical protein
MQPVGLPLGCLPLTVSHLAEPLLEGTPDVPEHPLRPSSGSRQDEVGSSTPLESVVADKPTDTGLDGGLELFETIVHCPFPSSVSLTLASHCTEQC